MIDSYLHRGLRKKMVERLQQNGFANLEILAAMADLPRHYFLHPDFDKWAYEDQPFSIGSGQTISQPLTVARQTELLQLKKGDPVLEIGTGSGYQAAILHLLGAKVYSIERQENLFRSTKMLLKTLYNNKIKCHLGDGTDGLPDIAPFEAILLTAGTDIPPASLLKQLATGGRLVAPIGPSPDQLVMHRFIAQGNGQFTKEIFGNYRFVPMLPGIQLSKKANHDQ